MGFPFCWWLGKCESWEQLMSGRPPHQTTAAHGIPLGAPCGGSGPNAGAKFFLVCCLIFFGFFGFSAFAWASQPYWFSFFFLRTTCVLLEEKENDRFSSPRSTTGACSRNTVVLLEKEKLQVCFIKKRDAVVYNFQLLIFILGPSSTCFNKTVHVPCTYIMLKNASAVGYLCDLNSPCSL